MSILDPDFGINNDLTLQENMIILGVLQNVENNSVLLHDPHDEFNLRSLQDWLNGKTWYYDVSQCKAGDYIDFVNHFVLPLVNGQIDYLLVDNIDKIPDIEDKEDFEILLKYLAKGEEFDPFQNFIYSEDERIKKIGAIVFDKCQNRLVMRCGAVPSFLENCTYFLIDCRYFALCVNHYLGQSEIDKPLMLIFEGEAREQNDRLDECKRWLREMFSCIESIGHPFKQGQTYFFDNNGERQKITEHPELLNHAILPDRVLPETDFLLIHRYVDQFNYDEVLKYALDVVKEHHLPVIYLANGYELEQNPGVDLEGFDIRKLSALNVSH